MRLHTYVNYYTVIYNIYTYALQKLSPLGVFQTTLME